MPLGGRHRWCERSGRTIVQASGAIRTIHVRAATFGKNQGSGCGASRGRRFVPVAVGFPFRGIRGDCRRLHMRSARGSFSRTACAGVRRICRRVPPRPPEDLRQGRGRAASGTHGFCACKRSHPAVSPRSGLSGASSMAPTGRRLALRHRADPGAGPGQRLIYASGAAILSGAARPSGVRGGRLPAETA